MVNEMPEPPSWMADLPQDRRGFLVPAESAWRDGVAFLSKVPLDNKMALAITRSCAVCGYQLPTGERVYRAFSQADAAQIRLHERDISHDLHGPGHKSCIIYSTFVCPYLREAGAKLMRDSVISPGAPRGTRPAVMGFTDFALLMFRGPHNPLDVNTPETMPYFAYRSLVDDLPYRSPLELVDQLAEAVAHDTLVIDQSRPRQYWTDTADDERGLLDILTRGGPLLAGSRPVASADVYGRPYVALSLPPAGW